MTAKRAKAGKGKSVKMQVSLWYQEKTGYIHMNLSDGGEGLTSVGKDPKQPARYHKNLYRKLANILKSQGAPHPELKEDTE